MTFPVRGSARVRGSSLRWSGIESRLGTEIAEAAGRHPRLSAVYRWVVRHRIGILVALAASRGAIDGFGYIITDDFRIFADAGLKLTSSGWREVFSDSRVQVGPLLLLPYGLAARISSGLGLRLTVVVAISVTVSLVLGGIGVLRSVTRDRGRPTTPGYEFFFGLLIILGGHSWTAATSAHPAEGFIPLLWILAGRDARHGRDIRAGLWLGAGGGLKLWGLLGLPVLLLSPLVKRSARSAAIAGGLMAMSYGPLLLWGSRATLGYEWQVTAQSPLRLFLDVNAPFTWRMRLVQAIFILLAGAVLAILGKHSPNSDWAVPLGVVGVRLLVDPLDYHYYWLPVGMILLVGISTRITFRPSFGRIPLAFGYYATLLPFFVLRGIALAAWIAAASIALLAFAVKTLRVEPSGRSAGARI